MFITFEGTEGSGKGTQVELLARWLADRDPVVVREPGGTQLGEGIRGLVLQRWERAISPQAEMYLFLAARAQLLVEVIIPAVAMGRIVIADRYHDSTLAYQGGPRGLDVGWPRWLLRPDLTFLLELPVTVGLERRHAAGDANRFDEEELAFHEAVAAGYDRLAAAEPRRWVRLDATRPAAEVHEQVRARIGLLLEDSRSS